MLDLLPADLLPLADGAKLYLHHVSRPAALGGASKGTRKRYRTVFDKFEQFAAGRQLRFWQEVTTSVVEHYGRWLDERNYAYRSQFLELTTIKQAIKWMVAEKLLPEASVIALRVHKPHGSPTYCYTPEEVAAIIARCFADPDLFWLGRVLVALAYSGLRIGELAQLQWDDIDLQAGLVVVRDDSRGGKLAGSGVARTTKTHRSRKVAIHADLRKVLEAMPGNRDGAVFLGPLGGRLKPDTVRNVLQREVLLPLRNRFPRRGDARSFEDGRIHSFRHYFCTSCFRGGVPEWQIIEWLGHSDSSMVKLYRHMGAADETQRAMGKVQSLGGLEAIEQPAVRPAEPGKTAEK
ncbi:MAG: site-specific integrase [Phycisphaerae bacterium]|nr:site-specific integrase [Phycisphaerae bacterium]